MISTEPRDPAPRPAAITRPSPAPIFAFSTVLACARVTVIILFLGLCVGRLGALLWRGLWVDALATLCLAVALWSAWRLLADVARLLRGRRSVKAKGTGR